MSHSVVFLWLFPIVLFCVVVLCIGSFTFCIFLWSSCIICGDLSFPLNVLHVFMIVFCLFVVILISLMQTNVVFRGVLVDLHRLVVIVCLVVIVLRLFVVLGLHPEGLFNNLCCILFV